MTTSDDTARGVAVRAEAKVVPHRPCDEPCPKCGSSDVWREFWKKDDARGRSAPWLARKVSDAEHVAIAAEFRELLEDRDNEAFVFMELLEVAR